MRRAGFLIVVGLVFAAMTALVVVRAVQPDEARRGFAGRQTPVAVYDIEAHEFADIVEALGTARADETVTITARDSDTISRIDFESGDRVEAGTILAELTDREEAASLAEARATWREAQREYERAVDLLERGVSTRQRLDEASSTVERARARVNSIEARLADRIIRAPFSGVIGLREVSVGQLVRPGDAIASLDDTRVIKLDFTVPERFLAALQPGLTIAARTSAYPDRVFEGAITQINSRIDPITRAVTVRAEIDNESGRLLPGQLMTVEIRRDERLRPAVPGSAITRYLDQAFVFVVDETDEGASVRQVEVELGTASGDMVEIVRGVGLGDVVVSEGTHRIRDRMPVVVTERMAPRRVGTGAAISTASQQ